MTNDKENDEGFLNPSDAARKLGVSAKALRLYEQRGLLNPVRTAAGWRTYGKTEMERASQIAALRRLDLSLKQVAAVLDGDVARLDAALASHQIDLEDRRRQLDRNIEALRRLRAEMLAQASPQVRAVTRFLAQNQPETATLTLPWPWNGERFEIAADRRIAFIVGPLGSGKTRLAQAIASALPSAAYIDLTRLDRRSEAPSCARVEEALEWLMGDGATPSAALTALLNDLVSGAGGPMVVDMVEQGLDHDTQCALISYLRRHRRGMGPLFLMTRSSAILDLSAMDADEAILFCPANHSPPYWVPPHPGSIGFEAVESCLATPEVRARTAGVVAVWEHPH